MSNAHTFTGGCLCGAVRYRASAAPLRGVICHCELCRRHSGAPCLAFNDHVWTDSRIAWFDVRDALPRFGRSSTAVPSQA